MSAVSPTLLPHASSGASRPTSPIEGTPMHGNGGQGRAPFENGLLPSGASVPTTHLERGAGVSLELLSRLETLLHQGGAIRGEVAQLGDVDIVVPDGPPFSFPTLASLRSAHTAFARIFRGDEPGLQNEALSLLRAEIAQLRSTQASVKFLPGIHLTEIRQHLRPVVGFVSASVTDRAAASFEGTGRVSQPAIDGLTRCFEAAQPTDPNAFVQWVLRESYLETTEILLDYANKVKFFNDLKKKIRGELDVLRQNLGSMAGLGDDAAVSPPIIPTNYDDVYTGDGQFSEQDLTPEQKERLEEIERQRAHDAEVQAAIQEYEAAIANCTKTEPVKVPGYSDMGKTTSLSGYGEAYGDSMAAWYRSLSPKQQEAVRAYLEKNGMALKAWSEEHDTFSSNESTTRTVYIDPLQPGEDIENYLKSAGSQAAAQLQETVDGSTAVKWDINLASGPWGQTVNIKDTSDIELPQILVEEGYIPGVGLPGTTQGAAAWQEGDPVTNKKQLEGYIEGLESKLSSVGDDAQLANVDLQNILQKQQQTIQMMTNISKMLHDTALSVIRKIGG